MYYFYIIYCTITFVHRADCSVFVFGSGSVFVLLLRLENQSILDCSTCYVDWKLQPAGRKSNNYFRFPGFTARTCVSVSSLLIFIVAFRQWIAASRHEKQQWFPLSFNLWYNAVTCFGIIFIYCCFSGRFSGLLAGKATMIFAFFWSVIQHCDMFWHYLYLLLLFRQIQWPAGEKSNNYFCFRLTCDTTLSRVLALSLFIVAFPLHKAC